jgi:hypothetical protein
VYPSSDCFSYELLSDLFTGNGRKASTLSGMECPICGSPVSKTSLTANNLSFLSERGRDGTIDAAVTLARISWNNFPSLRLSADSQIVINELLKALQEKVNASLSPMEKMVGVVSPLMTNLQQLGQRIPSDVKSEFALTDKTLRAGLDELRKTAEGIRDPIQKDIAHLTDTINKLIYKPTVKGTVAEKSLANAWQEVFLKDQIKPLGGAGRTDILVIPYLTSPNSGPGEKIVVERKAGDQSYLGEHLDEVVGHARKNGATYAMLVYDHQENLTEDQRPIYLTSEGPILVCVTDVGLGGWKTAREVIEVLQLAKPRESVSVLHETRLEDVRKIATEMQTITNIIERLRKDNSSTLNSAEKVQSNINELERSLNSYRDRLRDALWPQRSDYSERKPVQDRIL